MSVSQETELNNDLATADVIGLDTLVSGQISDRLNDDDYFAFNVTGAGIISLGFASSEVISWDDPFRVEILDGSGTVLSAVDTGSSETLTAAVESAGTYYAHVSASSSPAEGVNYT